jgi:hypothetical protein
VRRIQILIISFFYSLISFAQDEFEPPDMLLPSTLGAERNPVRLVARLTKDKTGEKEKFDAIFLWVTRNIRYDYYAYYAPSGVGMPRIDRILKYKHGICVDYAFLMDSLCALANIRNVSVYGYAKDDLFDVNDSLFMDNHAWNAVKLDNYWYVYDPTWASGNYEYRYTKFSLWLIKWRKHFQKKIKSKQITFKSRYRIMSECDTIEGLGNYSVYQKSFKNRVLLRILLKFKLRLRWQLSDKVNLDYYLTEPELFAVTHFPDNPDWSLVATKNVRQFEGDSTYYHLTDSSYKSQKRTGRYCGECDNEFALEKMQKIKRLKERSFNFNKRNRFITSLCNFNISNLLYAESIPVEDSLKKVSLIDSSLVYINNSKNDLYQCRLNVNIESSSQKTKNFTKEFLLYEENKTHLAFIRSMMKRTYEETHKIRYFNAQLGSNFRSYRRVQHKLLRVKKNVDVRTKNYKSKEKTDAIKNSLFLHKSAIDSIQDKIGVLRVTYKNLLSQLSDNLWKRIVLQDSVGFPFNTGIFYRSHLLDNYKKPVVEVRKIIFRFENKYAADVHELIYEPSDRFTNLGFEIMSLINLRNKLAMEVVKLQTDLVKENILTENDISLFVKNIQNLVQQDICWIIGGSSKMMSVVKGYELMKVREEHIAGLIAGESKTEFLRYQIINKEIDRRKRKFGNVARHNLRISSQKKTFLLRYKRAYLKSLKEARKKISHKT